MLIVQTADRIASCYQAHVVQDDVEPNERGAMQAQETSQEIATIDINHLEIGGTYQATTEAGRTAQGEYLGIEVEYDDWKIILRSVEGSESIPVHNLASVLAA